MDGLERVQWAVHVPRSYDSSTKYPVLLLFHDDASSGAQILEHTSLGETADAHDFVIVAPNDDALAYVWNNAEDIDRARAVLKTTSEKLCLDLHQVIAVGYGSGGSATEQLSCTDWVRGTVFASYSLVRPEFRCLPENPIPTLWLAPTKTGFQPVEGGKDCAATVKVSFDRYEQMWRDRNGCSDDVTTFFRHESSVCRVWDCGLTPFVSCRIDGGRGWPGAPPRRLDVLRCDGPRSEFPQNETIWKFMASLGVSRR